MSEEKKPPREFEPITDPEDAKKLLRQGATSHASAMIWTKDQKQIVKTSLSLYSEAARSLRAAIPKEFDIKNFKEELEQSGQKECFFSVSLAAANIFFKAKMQRVDESGFQFEIPEQVYRVQRRGDVRLAIPHDYSMKVEFQDPVFPDKRMTKKVLDISAGGLSILVATDEEPMFQAGMVLKEMKFKCKGRDIQVDGEIRHIKPFVAKTTSNSGARVGIQFKSIRPGESQHIASYVFEENRKYYTRFL